MIPIEQWDALMTAFDEVVIKLGDLEERVEALENPEGEEVEENA